MWKAIVEINIPERDMQGGDLIDLIREGVQNAFPNFKVKVLELK